MSEFVHLQCIYGSLVVILIVTQPEKHEVRVVLCIACLALFLPHSYPSSHIIEEITTNDFSHEEYDPRTGIVGHDLIICGFWALLLVYHKW